MAEARYNELTEGMRMTDDDPSTSDAHARMHQLVARKPVQALTGLRPRLSRRSHGPSRFRSPAA